jgi:chromosome segregation ATPase
MTELKAERKKLEDQIAAIRSKRAEYIAKLTAERQALLDDVAQATGAAPAKPELTHSDLSTIEAVFNKNVAPLLEALRQVEAKEAAASVNGVEDKIASLKAARDEAAAALEEAKGRVKGAEVQLDILLRKIEDSKRPGERIKFESKLKALEREYNPVFREKILSKILNY